MIKNILITTSIVINGILLMYLTGVLPFLLFISVLVVCALCWYIRQLLKKMQTIDSDIEDLFADLETYQSHLTSISELEMFYGDETLQSLVIHSRDVIGRVQDFQFKYSSNDVFGDYIIEEEIEYDDEPETQAPTTTFSEEE